MDSIRKYFSQAEAFPPEIFSSLIVVLILIIICIIVRIKSIHVNPLEKPKGIMLLAEMFVSFFDNTVKNNMGRQFVKWFTPILGSMAAYLFFAFIIGLIGLPSPVLFFVVPLTLGFITFVTLHITNAFYLRWKYFKRYVEPFPFFLPINLISMWAPLLSLSFRLFGNALAGWIILQIVYGTFSIMQIGAANLGFLAVVITPILHAYFDLFSAFIQTTVFVMLTMLLVNNEIPDEYQKLGDEPIKSSPLIQK